MEYRNNRITIEQARNIDIVAYLDKLGFKPVTNRGDRRINFWYHSPFRNEATPSFHVNANKNRWYDHGEGKGGNLLDFAIRYHNCTIPEFLENESRNYFINTPAFRPPNDPIPEPKIIVKNVAEISAGSLLNYAQSRGISIANTKEFCKEVHYQFKDKNYFSIGFKNNAGGYALRNKFFKNCSSPNGVTTIKNGGKELAVFEGFFDFMTYLEITPNWKQTGTDFLILNSTSFFVKSLPVMMEYSRVRLFLDQGNTGQKCIECALELDHEIFIDESKLYAGFEDLNDWHQKKAPAKKRSIKNILH